jgi:hypothetical protein
MKQKAFVKLEKKLACDLRPGELFVLEPPDTEYFTREMNRADPMIPLYLRTNVPPDMFDDMDLIVYKVHVIITDPEDPAPPRVNPHAPPGMGNGR